MNKKSTGFGTIIALFFLFSVGIRLFDIDSASTPFEYLRNNSTIIIVVVIILGSRLFRYYSSKKTHSDKYSSTFEKPVYPDNSKTEDINDEEDPFAEFDKNPFDD